MSKPALRASRHGRAVHRSDRIAIRQRAHVRSVTAPSRVVAWRGVACGNVVERHSPPELLRQKMRNERRREHPALVDRLRPVGRDERGRLVASADCETPTSFESLIALIAFGADDRCTIFALKQSV